MKYINRGRNWYHYGQLDYAIIGLIIGDALGVPVEFKSREYLDAHPVTEMIGYGTYNKPSGTWSDDTSLTLALADSIAASDGNLDYQDIMNRFSRWLYDGDYTSDEEVFDVGNTTRNAINRFSQGVAPIDCGGSGEHENGNGSLMRILPLAFYLDSHDIKVLSTDGVSIISDISSLTHAHPISRLHILSCLM
jgi:thiamine-phosphate pyrophosphorylase